MARYRAWLIALYIPDQLEWVVCRSVEEEWLTYRRKLNRVGRANDLRLVKAVPFLTVREAEMHRAFTLALPPRVRLDTVSVDNPEWENLMDQPEMLALFQQFKGEDEDGGGTAARLPEAPRDPILLGEFGHAQEWPEMQDLVTQMIRAVSRHEAMESPPLYGDNDPENQLLSRLDRS